MSNSGVLGREWGGGVQSVGRTRPSWLFILLGLLKSGAIFLICFFFFFFSCHLSRAPQCQWCVCALAVLHCAGVQGVRILPSGVGCFPVVLVIYLKQSSASSAIRYFRRYMRDLEGKKEGRHGRDNSKGFHYIAPRHHNIKQNTFRFRLYTHKSSKSNFQKPSC